MAAKLANIIQKSSLNNFNTLRLVMAMGVLYNHSFVLFRDYGKQDITTLAFSFFDAGSLSVAGFFMISGLLLTQSFFQTTCKLEFILKRFFRLFPGLFISLLFIIFFIGPLATNLTLREYLTSRDTYRLLYNVFLSNEVFIFDIPSCFNKNIIPFIVNGSLWTMPFELLSCIMLFLFLTMRNFVYNESLKRIEKILIGLLFSYFVLYIFGIVDLLNRVLGLLTGFTGSLTGENSPLRLYVFFATGSALYFLRNRVVLSFWVLIVFLMGLFFMNLLHIEGIPKLIIEYLVIVYALLCYAGFKKANVINVRLDPSYGVYLYAWPIQQLISQYFPKIGSLESMIYTIPLTLSFGIASFKYIEKPALVFIGRLMNKVNSAH